MNATQPVFTCRSLDIVAHECGHAVLDAWRPGWLADQRSHGAQTRELIVKIQVKRRGGFAGLDEIVGAIDTARAPAQLAGRARSHVERLLARGAREDPVGADFLKYEIVVSEGNATPRTITIVDEGRPDDLAMAEVTALLGVLDAARGR